jgi:hypothetical protein
VSSAPILGTEWEPPPPMRRDLSRPRGSLRGAFRRSTENHTRQCYARRMNRRRASKHDEPAGEVKAKQVTPKGAEIPVPTRTDVLAALRRTAGAGMPEKHS